MRTLFGLAISLCAGLVLALLIARGRQVVTSFGQGLAFVSMMILAVGGNAAIVFIPAGHRAPVLFGVALAFFSCALMIARPTETPGGPNRAMRAAWKAHGALLVWCFYVDAFVGGGIYLTSRWFTYAAAFAVWLGVGLLAGKGSAMPQSMAFTGAIVLTFMTLPTVVMPSFWAGCSTGTFDKCSVAGGLYRSFAGSENYIAIIASFTLIPALVALRGRLRVAVVLQAGIVLVASGSRTGLLSLALAGLVAVVAMRSDLRRPNLQVSVLTSLMVSCAIGLFAVHLVLTSSEQAISRRGAIWTVVREALAGHLATGIGLSKWTYFQHSGHGTQHFFHSGYALALLSGGLVGVTLLCLWLAMLLRSGSRSGMLPIMCGVGGLLAIYSVTEVVWNPLAIDGLTWIVASVGILAGAVSRDKPVPDESVRQDSLAEVGPGHRTPVRT